MNMISKCLSEFLLEETTRFIKKTVVPLAEVFLNRVIFNMSSQLNLALENEYD